MSWKDLLNCTSQGISVEVCKVVFTDNHRINVHVAGASEPLMRCHC